MIVEVRSYRIKPGRRDEFIKFFEERAIPALRSHGMNVLGPMLESYDVILCETAPGYVCDGPFEER